MFGFLKLVVEERQRAGPRHIVTLSEEFDCPLQETCELPTKEGLRCIRTEALWAKPIRMPSSAKMSRKGVPLPRLMPFLTQFG